MRWINAFVEKRFDNRKKGTTFTDIESRFGISKFKAQRILKRGIKLRLLFTMGRTKPQIYYPESRHFDVIEYYKTKTVPNDTTSDGVISSSSLEAEKSNRILELLDLIKFIPLYIHKIQVLIRLDEEIYNSVNGQEFSGNHGRKQSERIDKRIVTYIYHRNGNLEVHVACSNRPFKLETQADIDILGSFFGQVRDRIEYHISDPHGRLVPNITAWTLKQCDFNKDIPITDNAQITLPDVQLTTALETFRLYVKNVNGNACYRIESSIQVSKSLAKYLANTINPNHDRTVRISNIEEVAKEPTI